MQPYQKALEAFEEHQDVEIGIVTIGNKANSFLKKETILLKNLPGQ